MSIIAATPTTRTPRFHAVGVLAALAALICIAPALAVLWFALAPNNSDAELGGDLLHDGALGTFGLMLLGGGAATLFGALSAWLVSLCEFPRRRAFEWLLVLPMAAPSYVLSYSYSSLTWSGGAVNFPIVGFWGAAFVYAVGLYPYAYLSTRAAFLSQSACALEAARTLGASPLRLMWRVALPMARPGIAAGAALAAMEIAADYGAAAHFGVTTLSTGIFRAWYGHGAPHLALQISAILLVAAFVFLLIERRARGRAAYAGGSTRWRALPRYKLKSGAAALAITFCASLTILGALLPLAWLLRLAILHPSSTDLAQPLFNSLILAGGGALITLVASLAIAAAARRANATGKAALFAASVGYAAPGAVIAMGALALFGAAREAHWIGGFGGAIAIAALIWTYAARFASAGVQPIEAGLTRLSKGLDASARLLGASPLRRLIRIDLPIAAPSAAAAALILFVEILKELPATLILRPFNFDTLAIKAYNYASDERLLQAAAPSLLIFVAGLIPILLVSGGIAKTRAGAR